KKIGAELPGMPARNSRQERQRLHSAAAGGHSGVSDLDELRRVYSAVGMNNTQTAWGTAAVWPLAVSMPVCGSTLKTTRLLVSRLAQISQEPSGERLKFRGCAPPEEMI